MTLIARDLQHIWHPCAQMKDFEQYPPLIIHSAKGSYLYTDKGPVIDAISSWWCKSLGHGHPEIVAAIKEQLDNFEHVIAANTTHWQLIELGEKLAALSGLQHVFFASDGSSAVEIALKLALHAKQIQGSTKNEFIALRNSYHGETLGALSISDLGLYKKPYTNYGVKCHFLKTIPYVSGSQDPLWANASDHWSLALEELEKIKDSACAIFVEPLIQGASGMHCYSADFLKKLAQWAKKEDIFFIADEIMTGLGRTGDWLACHHVKIKPDLICLSKGLTAGSLPLSCVLIDASIYNLFYEDYEKGNSFLHSHTYSGNALAVSAAVATLKVLEQEKMNWQALQLGDYMRQQFEEIAAISGKLKNIRSLGAIVAADLIDHSIERIGYKFHQEALNRGALLRPLGNTVYWLPPLNIPLPAIENLAEITLSSIKAVYNKN